MAKSQKTAKKDLTVVQSNNFINSCTTDMKLNQLRILYFLLSTIEREDELFVPIEIDYKTVKNVLGDTNDAGRKKYFEDILRELARQTYYVIGETSMSGYPWFQFFDLDYDLEGGKAIFQFNPLLEKELLEQKKNFTVSKLSCSLHFSSTHTFKLYDLLKCEAHKGTAIYSVKELREKLNLLNPVLKIDKLDEFKEFSRGVLQPCIAEINEKSDIFVEYNLVKDEMDSRKTWGVSFAVEKKKNYKNTTWKHFEVNSVLEKREKTPTKQARVIRARIEKA